MGQVTNFVGQHLADHPELVSADIVEKWKRIYEAGNARDIERDQLLLLFGVSLPEGSITIMWAWDVIHTMKSYVERGIQVKARRLKPGMKVQAGHGQDTIRAIGPNFSVYLQGRTGVFNPLSIVPS